MKKRTIIISAVILIFFCIGAFLLYQKFAPQTYSGEKDISVTVIYGDKTEKTYTYRLFITEADGESADTSLQQWWCITKGGETVNTSADQTPVQDNDKFELTLKEGY